MSLLNNLKKWQRNMSVYFLGGAFRKQRVATYF